MSAITNTGHVTVACRGAGTTVAAVSGVRGGFIPAVTPVAAVRERGAALAPVAVVANERTATAYGFAVAGVVAEAPAQLFGQQKSQLHPMWALRGLDPWTDPT
ncbi:hypothetical protein HCN52_24245 [Streptomyces bohaiensis]|uniref:Uncharacterized protein n=1 Tax=Streptomyces bohaiensis TaxID=1431344 RepID=A0ABX1CKL2_9ACTN|nr:hypothetical protein [Streptomyces bohaiensis]